MTPLWLDTSVVVAVLNDRRPDVRARLAGAARAHDALALSAVALHELEFGVAASARPDRNAAKLAEFLRTGIEVQAFDADDAREAGAIRAHLKRVGTPIGPFDLLIAAHARRRGGAIATLNAREFQRVPDLSDDDWDAPRSA